MKKRTLGTVFLLVLLAGVGYIGYSFWFKWDFGENQCEMTYMFPRYLHVKEFNESKKYQLYLYREMTPKTSKVSDRDYMSNLNGIPVLFIPGNSGSNKQVRSIASEAARMFEKPKFFFDSDDPTKMITVNDKSYENTTFSNHFDFFAVDFEEELSAFSGSLLTQQTYYVNQCIQYLLKRYSQNDQVKQKPTSVILIGHSMGGVISRSIFRLGNFNENSVNTIFTLNSPHIESPLLIHHSVAKFYQDTNDFWKNNSSVLSGVTIVSVGGGIRDTLVRSDLSILPHVSSTNGFTVTSTSVPNVWLSIDHQCIMWCNQIVKVITKCLFELIDPITSQSTLSTSQRINILRKHFESSMPSYFGLDDREKGKEKQMEGTIIPFKNITNNYYPNYNLYIRNFTENSYLFDLKQSFSVGKHHFYLSTNLEPNQVSVSLYNSLTKTAVNMSSVKIAQLEDSNQPNLIFYLPPYLLHKYNQLFLEISPPKKNNDKFLIASLYSQKSSNHKLPILPFEFFDDFKIDVPKNHPGLINISLPLQSKLFPLKVSIKPKTKTIMEPVSWYYTPSLREEIFQFSGAFLMRFHTIQSDIRVPLHLLLFLEPGHSYDVTFKVDIVGFFVELIRSHGTLLFSLSFIILFVAMGSIIPKYRYRASYTLSSALLEEFVLNGIILLFAVLSPVFYYTIIITYNIELRDIYLLWVIGVMFLLSFVVLNLFVMLSSILFSVIRLLLGWLSYLSFNKYFNLVLGIALTFVIDPAVVLAISTILLAVSKTNDTKLLQYRQLVFTLYALCTALMSITIIIWIKNLPWFTLTPLLSIDSDRILVTMAILHITLGTDTIPGPPEFTSCVFYIAACLTGAFALFHFYTILDITSAVAGFCTLLSILSERRNAVVKKVKTQ